MKRSLLYQVGGADSADFETLVREVCLADELGVDTVWCFPATGEDGGFGGSAPAIWLSALAARTERIRLGWGLADMTPPKTAPMRVAEQVASIDQASGGRLEVGLLPTAELVGEGDLGWQEGFRMLVEMWDEPTFSWTSPRFTVRPVDVVPKPAQHPHPAIWLVGWSVEHAIAAGLGGLGYLDVSGADVDMLEVHRDAYSESRAGIDPNDLVSTHTFGVAGDLEDGEEGADQLAAWEALGVDHAIARAGPLDGGHDESISLIRNLTSAATDVL